MRYCCLGSGSEGNALVVEASGGLFATRLLIDNGFGPRQLDKRLARAGLSLADLDAVFVTHEHDDHVRGVASLLQRRAIPLICSAGTRRAAGIPAAATALETARANVPIALGELCITPFAVPHDAADPLQLVVSDGDRKLALLTDIGRPTTAVVNSINGVHALLLECNHDSRLLFDGGYPEFLKTRIAGDRGHLSNVQAGQLLKQLNHGQLNAVIGMHLSQRNNRPDLARSALAQVLKCKDTDIGIADQQQGFDWRTV